MKYDIYYAQTTVPGGMGSTPRVGIEIQPPLTPEATQGLIEELVTPEMRGYNPGPLAVTARLTRSDKVGTASSIAPNLDRVNGAEALAQQIGTLIDPCRRHETHIHRVPPVR